MDMCQEMSQYPPITTDTEAANRDQMYQGTESVTVDRLVAIVAAAGGLAGKVVAIGSDSLGVKTPPEDYYSVPQQTRGDSVGDAPKRSVQPFAASVAKAAMVAKSSFQVYNLPAGDVAGGIE
jgi:hypothetical protein